MPVRLDKFLWSVRLFKTRNQATDACRGGKVSIEGFIAKASREVKVGDEIEVRQSGFKRRIKVKVLLEKRVGAKLVSEYILDITPVEELERLQLIREMHYENRGRGMGRPSKKERRDIDRLKGINDD
jgi:ribosome-associated heat shock protein Hsp15